MSDLIDREQAKDAIDKYLVGRNLVTDGTFMARLINEIVIDRLPSAEPTFDARDTQYNLPIGTDTISRAQAIDAVKRLSLGETDATRLAMRIGDYLERLPSEPPKMGKWIYHIDDLFPAESTMECNQCHAEQPLTCDDEFCPHCGAKMEVPE